MQEYLSKLLQLAGPGFSGKPAVLSAERHPFLGAHHQDFLSLLNIKNGFFAFESALRFFSTATSEFGPDLGTWNDPETWIEVNGDMAAHCFFFAEDIFGVQFCIFADQICTFDPETGRIEAVAADLNGWAKVVLEDFEVMTGHPLARAWQQKNGPLPYYQRLQAKIPFVLGGPFALENLFAVDGVKGMRSRGELAQQIRDLPEGGKVKLEVLYD